MDRYFFHIIQDDTLYEDYRGGELLPSLYAAWDMAISDARGLVQGDAFKTHSANCRLVIANDSGAVIGSLSFERLLQLN